MITQSQKEQILQAARIDEVVGSYVVLKRRGANLLGLCPFHNERTPSFTVSPAKGFFKCFGCGKAGDSVTFLQELEHLTFPEALRFLAKKYNIEIEEEAPTPEMREAESQRESLFVVSSFAKNHFKKILRETEEGKAIGLSYFHERGFSDETIEKFELGYAEDKWDGLTKTALDSGFKIEFLEKAGLTIVQENKQYDRFRGRVIFPVHSLTGKVIAFGARILKTDPKSPKYLNSPETEIYHKGKTLYGIFQSRRAISQLDLCYLVEGYTDVISMHQAGIENVVASSGTALTVDQIRLIGRYTKNITVLYDGDPAGIKASLRGIDLILEEGMNVRVVLFPEGEDPDSFSRNHRPAEVVQFLKDEAVDFISFKTKLLLSETQNDPIKRAGLIHEVINTLAKVPDAITRSAYLKQASVLMEMAEPVLLAELNKQIRSNLKKNSEAGAVSELFAPSGEEITNEEEYISAESDTLPQEEEIIRVLLQYADHQLYISGEPFRVKDFIVREISDDGIHFSNEIYAAILADFTAQVDTQENYEMQGFISNLPPDIKTAAVSVITPRYELSNWESKGIPVKTDLDNLYKVVVDPVIYLKKKQLYKMRRENQDLIRDREKNNLPVDDLLEKEQNIFYIQSEMNKYTNTVIQK